MPPDECPNCGEPVPDGASACPGCGSDSSTGWSQTAYCDNLGIPDPDEEFDYNRFVDNEFGRPQKKPALSTLILAVVAIVVIFVLLGIFR